MLLHSGVSLNCLTAIIPKKSKITTPTTPSIIIRPADLHSPPKGRRFLENRIALQDRYRPSMQAYSQSALALFKNKHQSKSLSLRGVYDEAI